MESQGPPSTSQVTSSRSAEAAQPRPLNKGLPGRAAQGVDWGRGSGQSCCRLRGGRPDFLQLRRGREGAALQEGVLVRGGRREHGGALNQARTLSCWLRCGPRPRFSSPLYLPSWNPVSLPLHSFFPSATPFTFIDSPTLTSHWVKVRAGLSVSRSGLSCGPRSASKFIILSHRFYHFVQGYRRNTEHGNGQARPVLVIPLSDLVKCPLSCLDLRLLENEVLFESL